MKAVIAKLKYIGREGDRLAFLNKEGKKVYSIKENLPLEKKLKEGKYVIAVINSKGEAVLHIGPIPIFVIADMIIKNELQSTTYREIFNNLALDLHNNNPKYKEVMKKIVRGAVSDYAIGYALAVMVVNYNKKVHSRRKRNRRS
jgi:hypothetical protein